MPFKVFLEAETLLAFAAGKLLVAGFMTNDLMRGEGALTEKLFCTNVALIRVLVGIS